MYDVMALTSIACGLVVAAFIIEARVCSLGNEPDTNMRTRWITVRVKDPCECTVTLPGGLNAAPVLHRTQPVMQTQYPIVSDDPEEIRSHFKCVNPRELVLGTTRPDPTLHRVPGTSSASPTSPGSTWIQLLHYDRSKPNTIERDRDVLGQWISSNITEVRISLGSNSSKGQHLSLLFDARDCNSTSWFTPARLLSSPWTDMHDDPIFSLNWLANGGEILGIQAEFRGMHPFEGWLRWALPGDGSEESETSLTGNLPVIAFGRKGKVHWTDRGLLSRDRPVSQSSTAGPALGEYGVDLDSSSRTSTGYEFEPWWMVDLGEEFSIEEITIMGCAPGKGKTELFGAQFRVGVTQSIDEGTPCGLPVQNPPEEGTSLTLFCANLPSAQYLSMRIDGAYGTLGFCGINAVADGGRNPTLRGQPTWQSSVLTRNASHCVDGQIGVHRADLTCCQTGDNSYSWWGVDLGDLHTVTMVIISPFPDPQQWTDMTGATVVVSDVDNAFLLSAEPCGGALAFGDLLEHRPLLVDCVPDVTGRYVFIRSSSMPLSMCEVEVFGKELGNKRL
ncbi:uncharacterized protein LOC110991172 isoform X2 [Acanthaster planci]|uniref:Uncharacterized protein LOC110991172 isoform X2 n=1 Tax=Acanthaster planci TaxID=133434 RepID=A0A8B8A2Y7_ACAPL|nr:uncharacterized protein LOC110991172 isoform X2 [Acanthaster planci]